MNKCWTCGKEEQEDDEFYCGPCPYAMEMCVTQEERDEQPDEIICDECYYNKAMDI